jgi:hypothetical protein
MNIERTRYKSIIKLYQVLLILIFTLFSKDLCAGISVLSDSTKSQNEIILYGFYQHGWVLPTNAFIRGNNIRGVPISGYRSASLQLSVQSRGEKLWEQLYNFPRYGIGLYKPQFPDAPYLGNPLGIYGTMSFAIKRWETVTINLDVGFGMTFNWRSYLVDKYNVALGASESIIFNPGFSIEKRLNNGLMFNLGTGFVHYSNGSLKIPNLGINIFSPRAGVGYNFSSNKNCFKYQIVPEYQKQTEYLVSAIIGWRNQLYDGSDVDSITLRKGVYYSIYGISFDFNRQLSYKSKIGAGIMADYIGYANSSISAEDGKLIPHPSSFNNGLELSIYPSYELVMNRVSLVLQPGFYIYRTKYPECPPSFYQRIGLKYYMTDDISLSLNMRAHEWSIADFIEWTIGYSIR